MRVAVGLLGARERAIPKPTSSGTGSVPAQALLVAAAVLTPAPAAPAARSR